MKRLLNIKVTICLYIGLIAIMPSCTKNTLPVVTTEIVTEITYTTAKSGGNVKNDGGTEVTARGICWSKTQNPYISTDKTSDGTGIGSFTSYLTGLAANTMYYVRAYATNSTVTSYGNEESFMTSQFPFKISGLISYFNFDNNLQDQLGNTPAGVDTGGALFTDGKNGSAISLNGTNQYIQFGRTTYKSGNCICVALWFKSNTAGLRYMVMCSDFGIWTETNAVYTKTGSAGMAISLPETNSAEGIIVQNDWVHLVGTYDGTSIKVYINSVLAQTTNWPGNISDPNRNLTLGYFSPEGYSNPGYWEGTIDDLFIFDKVLTQEEVNYLFNFH